MDTHQRTQDTYNGCIASISSDVSLHLPSYVKFKRVDVNGTRCTCKDCATTYDTIKNYYNNQVNDNFLDILNGVITESNNGTRGG